MEKAHVSKDIELEVIRRCTILYRRLGSVIIL